MRATASERRALLKLTDLIYAEHETYHEAEKVRWNEASRAAHTLALDALIEFIAGTGLEAGTCDDYYHMTHFVEIGSDEFTRRFEQKYPPPEKPTTPLPLSQVEFAFELERTVYNINDRIPLKVLERRRDDEGHYYLVKSQYGRPQWFNYLHLRIEPNQF